MQEGNEERRNTQNGNFGTYRKEIMEHAGRKWTRKEKEEYAGREKKEVGRAVKRRAMHCL
jgi:hypothetical protein